MLTTIGDGNAGQLAAFLQQYPAFAATGALDALRAKEFARLDAQGHVYLDYTGGGLYAESQIRRHAEQLLGNVFGNPHSSNPTSTKAAALVEQCRAHVLSYFNASPAEYELVFTANASQALKLVGESYPFEAGSTFLLTFDNHNSVNGIREFARARGARTVYVPVLPPDLRAGDDAVVSFLSAIRLGRARLHAYPAQSNITDVKNTH
ncbi:MAG: aminotransferase class V-fold PLP-dependent enzyme, partial [Acidobacteria bacterium]